VTLSASLAALHAASCAQDLNPPSWEEVAGDARKLRAAAAHADAALLAGLASDSVLKSAADSWPEDVTRALEHVGLLDKYSPTTLSGVLTHLSAHQKEGLTSQLKGAVLELHVQDAMNAGEIPMVAGAVQADLAASLNQSGWDIVQKSEPGEALAYVQVKATESWQYIAQHLSRYPEVPIVATTREAALSATGNITDTADIIDTGVSSAELTAHVASTVDNLDAVHAASEFLPEIAFAAIGIVALVKLKNGSDRRDVFNWVKEQAALAGLANAAGLASQIATGTVVLRPLATMGVRFTADRGRVSQRTCANMIRIRSTLDAIRQSYQSRGSRVGGTPEIQTTKGLGSE
jgi:hypothetical protein